jgi:alcohol dehydrogenase
MHIPGYYEFCCRVKIISGHQALEKIPGALAALHAKKAMIVADKGVSAAGLVDIVVDAIKDGIEIGVVHDDVPQDSDLHMVSRLAAIYSEKGCDSIIAVGGGSVMDTAKGVNILVSEKSGDLMQFYGAGVLKKALRPLVAVPTTAGTGSEVTQVAVIKNPEDHRKVLFVSYFLMPDIAVLDSRMTLTLPPAITAATGMDALTHAIEAYTCLAKNPISDVHALTAIKMLSGNLLRVVKNPDDREGRLEIANGATLAGIAFSNSMVGMVHTLGHSVGAVCGVPHGVCMAIFLPYGLEYNMHKNGHFTGELLAPLAGRDVCEKTAPDKRASRVVDWIRQLNQDLFAETGGRHARFLKEIVDRDGRQVVPKESLPAIARTALGDGSIFYNPEDLDFDDLLMVAEAAWEGKPLELNRIKKG